MTESFYYLVRHAQRETHGEDTGLTQLGREQANATGLYLASLDISRLISSPLLRARETAAIFKPYLGLEVDIDSRLTERVRFGDREGERYRDFLQWWRMTEADRNRRPPEGDSAREAGERGQSVLDDIPPGEKAVIVSHFGTIQDIVRNMFDDADLPLVTNPHGGAVFIDLQNCSITELARHDDGYTLERINDVSHLQMFGAATL